MDAGSCGDGGKGKRKISGSEKLIIHSVISVLETAVFYSKNHKNFVLNTLFCIFEKQNKQL